MIIEIKDKQITGMDNVVYSALPYPQQGEEFELRFTCMFDDEADIGANPFEEQALISTGLWSYRVLGKLVGVDNEDGIALADCGACMLPIPVEVSDPDCQGRFICFDILRLDIWRR